MDRQEVPDREVALPVGGVAGVSAEQSSRQPQYSLSNPSAEGVILSAAPHLRGVLAALEKYAPEDAGTAVAAADYARQVIRFADTLRQDWVEGASSAPSGIPPSPAEVEARSLRCAVFHALGMMESGRTLEAWNTLVRALPDHGYSEWRR